MKNKIRTTLITLVVILFSVIIFSSCEKEGRSRTRLHGDENTLPAELKGLKVYSISLGGLDYVKVAVLDNKVNSTTYTVGKTQQSTIIIELNNRIIKAKEIISENDSIIVIRK